jgi:hypothetical protein
MVTHGPQHMYSSYAGRICGPKKVSAQQVTPRGEQPEFNTMVEIDLSTGAITGIHPAQVFGDTPAWHV